MSVDQSEASSDDQPPLGGGAMGDLLHSSLLTLTLTVLTCPRADYPSHYAASKIKKLKLDPAPSNVRISIVVKV